MAKKPDGKAAGVERVTFTRPAADRIAKVVRIVEAGDRDGAGLTFTPRGAAQVSGVRLGKIACDWAKGTTATVQQYTGAGQVITGKDFEAINRFAEVNLGGETESWVACVLIGSTWHLIAAECHSPAPGS